MASAVSNLLIYQGSDFIIDFTVENDNGTDFNLTGFKNRSRRTKKTCERLSSERG